MTQLLWYLRRHGQVSGPFPTGQLREQWQAGELSGMDEVSLDGLTWQRVEHCEVLRAHFEAACGAEPHLPPCHTHEVTLRPLPPPETGRRPSLWGAGIAALALFLVAGLIWLAQPPKGIEPGIAKTGDCARPAAPGVSWRGCERSGARLENANLRGADLVQVNLEGADLTAADLAYANLGLARLRGASLRRANLTGATLNGAILTEADLSGADLRYASLRGARLEAARIEGARLANATWVDGRICSEGSIGLCR